MRQAGELFQAQRLVQLLLDVHQHAQQALLVNLQGDRLHRRSAFIQGAV